LFTFLLHSIDPALLADDSDQADATLAQLALRLPGDIASNRHLVGAGVAIELEDDEADDLEPSTIGLLLRAAWDEREAAAEVG
jgi:hypothetical protein